MKKNVQRLLTISILTSMTGAGIFAINKLINASAVIRNALHNKSQYFYDWKFGRIHYTIEGSGSPLLLYMIFPLQAALSNGNFSKSSLQKITQYTAWICWAVDVLIVRKSLIQTFFMFS